MTKSHTLKCAECGKKLENLPFKCRRCEGLFCGDHRLPESHECIGLHKHNSSEKWFKNKAHYNKPKENNIIWDIHHEPLITRLPKSVSKNVRRKERASKGERHFKKQASEIKLSEKIKYFISNKFYDIKKSLLRRDYGKYNFERRKKYLGKILLIFLVSIFGLSFFYSRAEQFNQVSLWIFNLGGILILTSIFFAIKYGLNIIKEFQNIYKRQRKWIRIIVILILFILAWQIISNGGILLEKGKDFYSQVEFSLLFPFSLSKSPSMNGNEVAIPNFFKDDSCAELENHAENQYLNSAKYKKNFCGAICADKNLEYQRYSCDKEDKFHCYCKEVENE